MKRFFEPIDYELIAIAICSSTSKSYAFQVPNKTLWSKSHFSFDASVKWKEFNPFAESKSIKWLEYSKVTNGIMIVVNPFE